MTFIELLTYVGSHTKYDIMDGDAEATLAAARNGSHKNPVAGKVIADMYQNSGLATPVDAGGCGGCSGGCAAPAKPGPSGPSGPPGSAGPGATWAVVTLHRRLPASDGTVGPP